MFGFVVEDKTKDRTHLNLTNRTFLRNRNQDCLEFLKSTVNIEIYEEIKHLDQPVKIWSYLRKTYSKRSISRLTKSMNELQTISFNLESFDLFIEKCFKKCVRKIKDCGLELEDTHLNLYLLSSLEKSKRISDDNRKELQHQLDCEFDEFANKIKNKIISNPNTQYSDISNESISLDEDDNSILEDEPQLTNLSSISSQIDNNLQKYELLSGEEKTECHKLVDDVEPKSKNDELNCSSGIARKIPDCWSPIKTIKSYSQTRKVDCQTMDFQNDSENLPSTSKVYEDLIPVDLNFAEESTSFKLSSQNELDAEVKNIRSENYNYNFLNQLEEKEERKKDVNLPDFQVDIDSDYFFIDKSGTK